MCFCWKNFGLDGVLSVLTIEQAWAYLSMTILVKYWHVGPWLQMIMLRVDDDECILVPGADSLNITAVHPPGGGQSLFPSHPIIVIDVMNMDQDHIPD